MEHADAHRERLLGRLVFAGVSWVVFHVWPAVYNGALYVFNHGYDNCGWQIYALPAAYLLSLLLFDGLAYFAKSLTAGLVLAAVFGLSAGHVAYFLWVHRLARDHKDRRTDGSRSWRTQNE